MLSHAEVAALAQAVGLGAAVGPVVDAVRPGWRLEPADEGRSRLGGQPDLTADERWPHNERGVPLTFLGQIDCSALPPLDAEWRAALPWAHGDRLLRVFADHLDDPFGDAAVRVLEADATTAVRRVQPPPVPDPFPDGGPGGDADLELRIRTLGAVTVVARPFLTAAHVHPDVDVPAGHFEHPALIEFDDRLRLDGAAVPTEVMDEGPRPWSLSHVAGHAYPEQDDPRYGLNPSDPEAIHDWCTLLSIGQEPRRILDGEVARIFVLLPKADLAVGDYRRARSVLGVM